MRRRLVIGSDTRIGGRSREQFAAELAAKKPKVDGDSADGTKKGSARQPRIEPDIIGGINWSKLDLLKVEKLVDAKNGVLLLDALALAKEKGKVIIPNSVHDRMIVGVPQPTIGPDLALAYPAWTGTLIIYGAPDTPLGEQISYLNPFLAFDGPGNNVVKIYFTVPPQFQNLINCALIIEHPNFDVSDKGSGEFEVNVADQANIHLIQNFPKVSGEFNHELQFKIPVENQPEDSEFRTLRIFSRATGSHITLVSRASANVEYWNVFASEYHNHNRGVLAIPREVYEQLKVIDKP